ncbi:MAG: TVP38/TMEM64 family protein [Parvularculaceae bacterium]
MVEFLRRLGRFLNEMDAKAMTSLGVSLILLVFVVLMFFYGQRWLHLDEEGAATTLINRAANSPWAVVGVISVYVLLALTGFPQILLIAATVIAFGPQSGAAYAWIATMASATFTFGLGHMLGGGWVRRFGGPRVQTTIGFVGRHGALASGLVRVVPSAPFIVVNAAAGAAHIPILKFWAGTGVGIVPKILLVAALGALAPDQSALREGLGGVVEFFTNREPRHLALLVLIVTVWLGFLLLVRWFYLRLRRRDAAGE